MARFDLSDREWTLIKPLLTNKPRGVGRVDDRRVLNGIFYVLRTGSPWRDLPERYGPYTTVYNRFNRWAKAGVWVQICEVLAARSPQSMALIDENGLPVRLMLTPRGRPTICVPRHFCSKGSNAVMLWPTVVTTPIPSCT